MALHALRRNVMRSVLTILGIVIGVAAVIAMMEIGRGSSYSVEQTIASLGASVIQVDPDESVTSGVSSGGRGSWPGGTERGQGSSGCSTTPPTPTTPE